MEAVSFSAGCRAVFGSLTEPPRSLVPTALLRCQIRRKQRIFSTYFAAKQKKLQEYSPEFLMRSYTRSSSVKITARTRLNPPARTKYICRVRRRRTASPSTPITMPERNRLDRAICRQIPGRKARCQIDRRHEIERDHCQISAPVSLLTDHDAHSQQHDQHSGAFHSHDRSPPK